MIHSECYFRGCRAEDTFIEVAKKQGYSCSFSTKEEDMFSKFDVVINNESGSFRVDVKARKKIHRGDSETQDEYCWVELHGVNEGNDGWLFGGQSDLIAFEKVDSFVLVPRLRLIEYVNNLPLTELTDDPYEAIGRIYQRRGRVDKLTLIPTSEIEKIGTKWFKW